VVRARGVLAILREFDLTVTGKYFPDYEREIGRRLSD
jgi:hypothetical protein